MIDELKEILIDLKRPLFIGELFLMTLDLYCVGKNTLGPINNEKMVLIIQLLLMIVENFEDENIKIESWQQSFEFLKNLLSSCLNFEDLNSEEKLENEDTLSMALGLLSYIVQNLLGDLQKKTIKITPYDKSLVHDFQKAVCELNLHPSEIIKETTSQMLSLISTLNTAIESFITFIPPSLSINQEYASSQRLEKALECMNNNIPSIRAMGMGMLRDLTLEKQNIVEVELQRIVWAFVTQIQFEDSFVYLNAVKSLSTLVDVHTARTLPLIASIYANKGLDVDWRLRIGETIYQAIQRLGGAVPKYAEQFITSILIVLHDKSDHMRSSAMSLVALVARKNLIVLMKFIHQILDYVSHVIILEKSVETRRGAIVVLLMFARGVDHDEIAKNENQNLLRKIHGLLKKVEASVFEDDILRGHARIALSDLGDMTLGILS
ncbi:transmembrane and coiled-coil domains-containing protein 7 [Nowakowskiella sp. JEL0078]|nr:transmembrane and coiled-coil domains-containing protein 7 [Nowakowskiella sp. JEL0078]